MCILQSKADQVQLCRTKETVQMRLSPASIAYKTRTLQCNVRHFVVGASSNPAKRLFGPVLCRGKPSLSLSADRVWLEMLPEGEGFPYQRSSEVSPKGLSLLHCGKPHPHSPGGPSPPSPSLPLAPHRITLVKAEMHPVCAQLIPRKPLRDSNSPVMVAHIAEESIFFPKMREHIRKLGILASQHSFQGRQDATVVT